MDRNSFLASLPFLVPNPSAEWPAKVVADGTRQDELLLTDQSLSIEPVLDGENVGVAFFEKDASVTDPAVSNCQVHFWISKQPPLLKGTTTPPHRGIPSSCAMLALQVERRSYFVNWHHLTSVSVEEKSQKPTCMLFLFDGCLFRIYSSATQPLVLERYQTLERLLHQVLSEIPVTRPVLSIHPFSTSPAGSTPVSSIEAEQPKTATTDLVKNNDKVDPIQARLGRKRNALQQAVVEMDSLSTVLSMPATSSQQQQHYQELASLMTTIADDLATANHHHIPQDVEMAQQRYEQEMEDAQRDLDECLNAFFPAPRSASASGNAAVTKMWASATETLQQVEVHLKRQQHAMEERNNLWTLPTRGVTNHYPTME